MTKHVDLATISKQCPTTCPNIKTILRSTQINTEGGKEDPDNEGRRGKTPRNQKQKPQSIRSSSRESRKSKMGHQKPVSALKNDYTASIVNSYYYEMQTTNCYNECQWEARGSSDNIAMCVARGATPNRRTESMQSSNIRCKIKMGNAIWTKGSQIGNAHHRKNYREYEEI